MKVEEEEEEEEMQENGELREKGGEENLSGRKV